MSGTYPTSPEFRAINFKSVHKNVSSESRSGRLQVRSIGFQRWSFTAQYRLLLESDARTIMAFMEKQRGMLSTFTIVLPVLSYARGTVSGSVRANGTHAVGDSTIQIDGISGTLLAGDFIKFASHSKIYMVVADRSGNGELTIEPPLISEVPNNNAITYDAVPFNVRMNNDAQQFKAKASDQYTIDVDMLEEIV